MTVTSDRTSIGTVAFGESFNADGQDEQAPVRRHAAMTGCRGPRLARGMNWLEKGKMTGIHSGQGGVSGKISVWSGWKAVVAIADCSMGMRFRGKGVNPSYTRVLY
jgi:hypothetical protein